MNTSKPATYFCVLVMLGWASPNFAEQLEFDPASNLKRGCFQQAVFNQDETCLLSASAELVQLWNLETGELLQQFKGHQATIHSVCFSPDQQQILTGAGKVVVHGPDDPTARLWNIASGNSLAVFSTVGKELSDQTGGAPNYHDIVHQVSFSPDGNRILAVLRSSSLLPKDAAVLWKLSDKEIDFVLPGVSTSSGTNVIGQPVQFSPDGKYLSGFVNDSTQAVIWSAETGEVRNRFNASDTPDSNSDQKRFEYLRWSPSGQLLLAVLSDSKVRIWDVPTGKELPRISGHEGHICDAYFLAEESQLVTASHDQTIRLWNIDSGKQIRRWNYADPIQEMVATPDGQTFLTRTFHRGDSNVHNQWFGELRNVQTDETIRKWELPPVWLAENQPLNVFRSSIMSPSGRQVLTPVWENGQVVMSLVNANTGATIKKY